MDGGSGPQLEETANKEDEAKGWGPDRMKKAAGRRL